MVQENDYAKFLQVHEAQLLLSGVPQHFWQTLYIKLKNQVFDSSETFALLQLDYGDETRTCEDPLFILQVQCEEGIKHEDKRHVYLVDHAWTYRVTSARQQLLEMSNLLDRMCKMMGVENGTNEVRADQVCSLMWKYSQTYSLRNATSVEDGLPIWYIMDELGSAINHSNTPNFRAVPLFYSAEQLTYTVMFPIKDVEFGEQVTRDFVESISDETTRKAQLMPWIKSDFTDVDFTQIEPDELYFLEGHIEESLPKSSDYEIHISGKIKVFSEYNLVNQFLTDDRFEITEDESNADILWYTRHFKTYLELSETPNKYVNQFPFEYVLTVKDLLSIVCRRKSGNKTDSETMNTLPVWFPTTYNLKSELCKFISYYQHREKSHLDNYWICKPWNLARSLDTHITNNLDYIVRLSATGPKIAQKYINNPVLFNRECGRVKFDVRYVILLKSVAPLKAYIYNNFFLRFSNKPFEMADFDDYEKHFTVMNYSEEVVLHHLPCANFLEQWKEQYPDTPWKEVEQRILCMLREVLEAATSVAAPRGIAPCAQSRAVYAADIILSWDRSSENTDELYMQPKLLEINWTPDCKRACDYYPNFYNDIFACLFLNDESSESFTCL
ncbi:Tubulin tyrosine ligase-like 12 [Carabus blaptoides fortunei]